MPLFVTCFLGLERNSALIDPIGDGRYRLFQAQGPRLIAKGEVENAADLAPGLNGLSGPVGVLVPEELVMSVELTVPQSARRTLHQVVEMEIERKTPFKALDVLYAYSIEQEAAGEITLALRLVPKGRLDELLTPLREAGVEIAAIHLDRPTEMEGVFAVVQPGYRAAYQVSSTRGLALLLLLLIAASSQIVHRQQAVTEMRVEAAALGQEVQVVQAVRNQLDQLTRQDQALREFVEERGNPLKTLAALSKTLPDSAWLTSASLLGGEVRVEGFAKDASQVVSAFGKAANGAAPKLLAPITKDPSGLGERFLISLETK